MYTGVVEHSGTVESVESRPQGLRVRIGHDFADLTHGESVAVNGLCLTAATVGEGWFEADLSAETVERTYLDRSHVGERVNLERPLAAGERFHGHYVKGTVDGTTEVVDVRPAGDGWRFEFVVPPAGRQYVVEKGAVAIDGVSLTVADHDRDRERFAVAVVPTTYELTTPSTTEPGDRVHVEWDVLAKYARRQTAPVGE